MFPFKKLSLLYLLFIISGCNATNKIGSGPLILNGNLENAYNRYLESYNIRTGKMNTGGAFALNPITGKAASVVGIHGVDPVNRAKQSALSNCGEGCFLFGVNGKIVWKGYTKPEKSNAEQVELDIDLNKFRISLYDPKKFRITSGQKIEFERYLDLVSIEKTGITHAFAISENGYSARSSYSENKSKDDYSEVKLSAIKKCEHKSSGAVCVLYAINDQLVEKK